MLKLSTPKTNSEIKCHLIFRIMANDILYCQHLYCSGALCFAYESWGRPTESFILTTKSESVLAIRNN